MRAQEMLRYGSRYAARVVDTEGDAGREQPLVSKKEQGYRCLGVLCYYPTRTGVCVRGVPFTCRATHTYYYYSVIRMVIGADGADRRTRRRGGGTCKHTTRGEKQTDQNPIAGPRSI